MDPDTADADGDVDNDGLTNFQEYTGVDFEPPKEEGVTAESVTSADDTGSTDQLNPIDIDTDNDGKIDCSTKLTDNSGNEDKSNFELKNRSHKMQHKQRNCQLCILLIGMYLIEWSDLD